jgi:hypothetical protein
VQVPRKARKCGRRGFGLLALALAIPAMPGLASAQGRLEAHYTMTLAGLPIGQGSWVIDISDSQYSSVASGGTTGLMRAFTGGEGSTAAQGTLQGGRPLLSTYAATIKSSKKTDEIRLTVNNGRVKDLKLDPPRDTDAERVPITDEDQHGVLDPMTASLVRSPGTGNPLTPEACQRTLAIFDGRLRYDLQLAFKRMDKVKADKGYEGPVLVCAVYFSPIAGHIPSRAAIKYISRLRDIEVWLAPIAGTRVLVPFRAAGPTPIGPAVLEATQFVSVAVPSKEAVKAPERTPAKAVATDAKPQ